MKHALVTGVTGFLGSRLARSLAGRGVHVIGLKRAASKTDQLAYSDLTGKIELHDIPPEGVDLTAILQGRKVDALFHTAALARVGSSEADSIALLDSNIRFPCRLLAQARRTGQVGAFINAGTSWQSVDGKTYSPFNFYAATKQAFEDMLGAVADADFPCASLRLYDPYGPGDYRNKIVNLLVDAALEEKRLDMSPGEQKISLAHVEDVARAFIAAAELALEGKAPGHHIYAVPGAETPSLRGLAALIGRLAGSPPPVAWGARAYRPNEVMFPYVSHPPVPGWSPRIALEDGLREVIAFHRAKTSA